MSFVFSIWYFVVLFIVAGIVACLVVFFRMDKKDRVLIDEFIKESTPQQVEEKTNEAEVKE